MSLLRVQVVYALRERQTVLTDYTVQEGDRVEIYRPLLADPMEQRRRRAAER
jgi:putative ubiquitin-RnfH superfamily antitoxin RatB of RatAB toxin-antitoxin module